MRIVLVTRVYPTHRPGGLPHVCQDRAEALAAAGHEVLVLTTGLKGNVSKKIEQNGVTIWHTECRPCEYTNAFALNCEAAVAHLRPKLVHLESCDRERPWWDKPDKVYRTAVTMHGFEMGGYLTEFNLAVNSGAVLPRPDNDKIQREIKVLRNMFDRVLAISLHEYRLLASYYNVAETKLRHVYNPIAPYFFTAPAQTALHDPHFLCAAVSGHSQRGFELAKQAADKAGYKLLIAKDISRDEMPAFIDQCRGLVIPTFYAQGFDLTFAEALARKRPIICTTAGSYFDESEPLLLHGECIRVSMNNVGQLATAMRTIVEHPPVMHNDAYRHRPEIHCMSWLQACLE